ncbi:beta-2-glycoprotein 1-like [Watersipora subatra]|uniref:beta-2-glycoprotein 1-like n=1 Tax=Watersipora subatra TaxID=2589382 RepID=UPI00355BCDDE
MTMFLERYFSVTLQNIPGMSLLVGYPGVSCGPPPLIDKSDAQATVITGTKYMDTANYTCLPGYEFKDGRDIITCQSNSSWTNHPTCDGVSCGSPPLIENSDAQATVIEGTKFMDTANYSCLPGYEFRDGRHTITCQSNSSWTNYPTCDGVSRGSPPLIEKSDAQATVITGTKYMDTANYTCLPGYEFRDGRDTITCQSNQSWTNPSTCDAVDCGSPPEVENGQPLNRYGNTTFESIIAYMCIAPEYQMLGSELVQCTEDGSWSALPRCYNLVARDDSDSGSNCDCNYFTSGSDIDEEAGSSNDDDVGGVMPVPGRMLPI